MKVIFWDFDGTITYSNPLWSNSTYTALKETVPDTPVEFEALRKYMAFGFTWHTPENDYSNVVGDKWWEFMKQHFIKSYVELGVNLKNATAAAEKVRSIITKTENYTVYDDAVEVLQECKNRGYINVILSNNNPELAIVLKSLNLLMYFDDVIISANIGYDKPRKEIFEFAKSKYPNAEYYMIGDSVNADIIGGNNAGMTTILVHNRFNENADYCFDNLHSIIEEGVL